MVRGSLGKRKRKNSLFEVKKSRRVVEVKKSGRKMVESRKKVENVTILRGGVNE